MKWEKALEEVRREPTYTNHCRALKSLEATGYKLPGVPRRIALLSNFTVDPLVTCLKVQACMSAFPADLYVGRYNEHAQEILHPGSGLHGFNPDIIFIALMPNAVLPGIVGEPWRDSETRKQLMEEGFRGLTGLLASLRERSRATILVSNLIAHEMSPLGIFEWQDPFGVERSVQEFNLRLATWVQTRERIHVADLAGICSNFGRKKAFDSRMRLLADQPFATPFLPYLAREVLRYLRATSGPSRKCLVLDLDNTLWGGILGEDGIDGLRLGGDAVGEAYKDFQRAILSLQSRGILLALCSRNDEDEAMRAIKDHPDMILRPDHFSAWRINWGDKVENIRSLAEELNIGLDSMVFVDDDPFERQNIRERLPQVLTLDLPQDPVFYRATLLEMAVFDTLQLTAEDRARTQMYVERRAHDRLKAEAGSLEDYLRSLDMEVNAVRGEGAARTRLFQLVHKTNQFNLTTRRYTEAEFQARLIASDYRVFGISVRDRLGDSGIVGLVVLGMVEGACEIETFLLSCRVLGRSIETGILAYVVDLARAAGAGCLRGIYIATAKNQMVRDLYARHGLRQIKTGDTEVWEADLSGFRLEAPPWARVRQRQEMGFGNGKTVSLGS